MALSESIVASIEELQARVTAGTASEAATVVTGGSASNVGYHWTRIVADDGKPIVTLSGRVTVTGDGADIQLSFPGPVFEGYNAIGTVTGDGTMVITGGDVGVGSTGIVTLYAKPASTATGAVGFTMSFIEGVAP